MAKQIVYKQMLWYNETKEGGMHMRCCDLRYSEEHGFSKEGDISLAEYMQRFIEIRRKLEIPFWGGEVQVNINMEEVIQSLVVDMNSDKPLWMTESVANEILNINPKDYEFTFPIPLIMVVFEQMRLFTSDIFQRSFGKTMMDTMMTETFWDLAIY